jgi:hypothetical protein
MALVDVSRRVTPLPTARLKFGSVARCALIKLNSAASTPIIASFGLLVVVIESKLSWDRRQLSSLLRKFPALADSRVAENLVAFSLRLRQSEKLKT